MRCVYIASVVGQLDNLLPIMHYALSSLEAGVSVMAGFVWPGHPLTLCGEAESQFPFGAYA